MMFHDVSHARFLSPGWPSDYRFPSKLWPEAWTMNQPHLDPRHKGIPQVRFGPEILGTVGSTRALSGSERPYNMTVAWHHLLVGLTFISVKQLNHVETMLKPPTSCYIHGLNMIQWSVSCTVGTGCPSFPWWTSRTWNAGLFWDSYPL